MWQNIDKKLYKKIIFKDFAEAFEFMGKVAVLSERHNHHPVIKNSWNEVELWLSTHSVGNVITNKDEQMAADIDALLEAPAEVRAEPSPGFVKQVKLFGDGGSRGNPGPSASGFVLLDMQDNVLYKAGVYIGITTNNQAEYQSLKLGLDEAYKRGALEVSVYMDSLLVINQMTGVFKVRNRDLWPIHEAIKESAKRFKKITYAHVPRELNKLADAEVNVVLDREAGK